MIKKNVVAAALTFAGLTLAASASAQVYVGAALGQAKWDINCAGLSTCKTSDTSYKFLGGYNFSQFFAVEASYFSLGELSFSTGALKAETRGKGFEFSGVIRTPQIAGISGFAKLGVAAVKGETNATDGAISVVSSNSKAQPVFGLGMTWAFAEKTSLRLEFERHKVDVANVANSRANVNTVSVGVQASY